ncbi:Protein of uncharacterised function (DUF1367) [Serratia quinivorans]|uniref:DUF1367 family protein n=1 Tax=Serratia quinivorans TaxID=137545 RepID=UPI0021776558|nr:DUF1367 family protein [Serratia quinivorans]CAI1619577.1 Protein of uncharacterised function (DUF1367) [Serratia quinivorans]CAI2395308.1 Protein of uncharacterised function (DUF1367) [Serratia quinivorans]
MTAAPRTKSSRKHKTEALGVLLPGGGIKYATDHDRDTMKGVPTGTPITMRPIGDRRNLKHHRKFWKLLELGFSYWEPDWTFVSDPEKWIAHEVAKTLAAQAGDPLLYDNITKLIADSVLQRVAAQRQRRFDAEAVKTTEAYLNHVMVKAGFYDLAANPDGGTLKQRWSIAFVNMSQEKFDKVYSGVAGVIWNETLQQHFAEEYEMEQAVNRLLEY